MAVISMSYGMSLILALIAVLTSAGEPETDPTCANSDSQLYKVCASCSESPLGISLDICCGNEGAFQVCQMCLNSPEHCVIEDTEDNDISFDNEDLSEEKRSDFERRFFWKRGDPRFWIRDPNFQKRAKYFLGKRASKFFLGKRPRNNFLGKRSGEDGLEDDEVYDDEEKRAQPFLGKRAQPFLGKRAQPFLGKRAQPFLGKRAQPFLGKRAQPFLGKKASPFLGKKASPFLGKRDDAEEEEEDEEKRAQPFLGKRAKYFLGKREDNNNSKEADRIAYLLKRAKYFLGKRAKYFLGKRDGSDQLAENLDSLNKRMRNNFLGKR